MTVIDYCSFDRMDLRPKQLEVARGCKVSPDKARRCLLGLLDGVQEHGVISEEQSTRIWWML